MRYLIRHALLLCCLGVLLACVPACKKAKKEIQIPIASDTSDITIDPASPLAPDVVAARFILFSLSSTDEYVKAKAPARIAAWKEAAEKGTPEGQWLYGQCLEVGAGVDKNAAEAVQWYRKAADRGFSPAQNSLGLCYREGVGVKEDDEEAVNWFRKAADQNDAAAQFNLGEMYEEGDGVKESMKEALKWYRKASAGGYAEATMRLMLAYEEGEGVPKDPAEAAKFQELAKKQLGPDAEKRIAAYRAQ